MAIHVDPNKYPSRLCFSQECPVIYRNFSGIFLSRIGELANLFYGVVSKIRYAASVLSSNSAFLSRPVSSKIRYAASGITG